MPRPLRAKMFDPKQNQSRGHPAFAAFDPPLVCVPLWLWFACNAKTYRRGSSLLVLLPAGSLTIIAQSDVVCRY